MTNSEITIYGDGTQTRSFCYVSNLVDGLVNLMDSKDNFTGPVNLGNPNEFSMNELAEIIIKLTKSKSKISYKNLPIDDPKQRQPDINLAKKELNWNPTIQIEEGLSRTIDYFKKII